MKKIPTLFKRDPDNMRRVLPEVTPGCEWVLAGEGLPTRKYDGTCVMLDDDGQWWGRREVKPGKQPPANFQAISTDENTDKTVGWEAANRLWPFHKYLAEAVAIDRFGQLDASRYTKVPPPPPHTYELIGPKINGNPEEVLSHRVVAHGRNVVSLGFDFNNLLDVEEAYTLLQARLHPLSYTFEGIVWHHPDGRMAKLKRKDFS